jgi:hypothetical protein
MKPTIIISLSIFLLLTVYAEAQINYTYTPAPVTDTINKASYEEAIESAFGLLPKAHYPSGYLFNKTTFPIKFHSANGQLNDSSFNMLEWYFIQNIARNSYYRPDSLPLYLQLDSLKDVIIEEDNVLPFGLVDITGHAFKDSALINNWLTVVNQRLVENNVNYQSIYVTSYLFSACPLNLEIGTLNPHFIFKPQFIFSNSSKTISAIDVDLDDGRGFRNVTLNYPFQATYTNAGFKKLITRIVYNSTDTLYSRSELLVNVIQNQGRAAANNNDEPDDRYRITAFGNGPGADNNTLGAYPGEFSEGFVRTNESDPDWPDRGVEVGVWYGCGNIDHKIRKPYLIFGGYNPKNGKSLSHNGNFGSWWSDMAGPVFALAGWRGSSYYAMNGFFTDFSKNAGHGQAFGDNGNRLLDKLRAEGYDVLIVRFRDGISLLQNNAYLATLVIKQINRDILSGVDNVYNQNPGLDVEAPGYPQTLTPKKAKHELVVSGYSAGALTARMALLLMEYENQVRGCDPRNRPHRTKTWVAFEHECQGSNTPIGFQMFLDFEQSMAYLPANAADILNSIMCNSALKLIKHKGVATQNTLYHISNMKQQPGHAWNVGHSPDFDNYFADLLKITPANYPANLRTYPKNCYRIAIGQGSANGIWQLLGNDVNLIKNQSPTTWCISGQGTLFGGTTTAYRQANGRVLSSWNNNVFTCEVGLNVRLLFYSFHINFGHSKYFVNNYVNDQIFGSPRPYDVYPASTLPSHRLLASKLPLSSRNLNIAALTMCNSIDWNDELHGFAPTVSLLDLHQPGNNTIPRYPDVSLIPGNVSGGLYLMQRNKYNNVFDHSPHNDFGYPHLTFPTNHYDYTPYDAIWAAGDNFDQVRYNDNMMHIEDPTPFTSEFIVEEIAPATLYLSNRTIKGDFYTCGNTPKVEKYYADFEARNSVLAGNESIYQRLSNPTLQNSMIVYDRQRTAPGDFIIDDGAVVDMAANNYNGTSSITLGPGFSTKHGSIFRAHINYQIPKTCPPFGYASSRQANNNVPAVPEPDTRPIISTKTAKITALKNSEKTGKVIALYPNPTNSEIYYDTKSTADFEYIIFDAIGKILQKGNFSSHNAKINLSAYARGIYYITITSSDIRQTDRIIVQ